MKTIRLMFLILLPLSLHAGAVKVGDHWEDVQAALGTPRGELNLNGRHLLYFARGEIEMRAGVVTRVTLRSEEAQAKYEAKRATEDLLASERQVAQRNQLSVEGEALKARMVADPAFLAAPLSYQVTFWRNFSNRYTMVPCGEQLNSVRARYYEQDAAEQRNQELAARVAELEAASRARDYQDGTSYPVYARGYGYRYPRHRRHDLGHNNGHAFYATDSSRPHHSTVDDSASRHEAIPRPHSGSGENDRPHQNNHRHSGRPARGGNPSSLSPLSTNQSTVDWLNVPRFVPLNPQI